MFPTSGSKSQYHFNIDINIKSQYHFIELHISIQSNKALADIRHLSSPCLLNKEYKVTFCRSRCVILNSENSRQYVRA